MLFLPSLPNFSYLLTITCLEVRQKKLKHEFFLLKFHFVAWPVLKWHFLTSFTFTSFNVLIVFLGISCNLGNSWFVTLFCKAAGKWIIWHSHFPPDVYVFHWSARSTGIFFLWQFQSWKMLVLFCPNFYFLSFHSVSKPVL